MGSLKVEVNLSQEEFQVAKQCLERRYYELRRKILEGDRKGRSIQRYRQEAQLLERVIEEIKHGISGY